MSAERASGPAPLAGAGAADEPLVILVTAPDVAVAERLAAAAVERRLAACANLLPGVTSIYRWEGGVQRDDEVLLVVKTTRDRLREFEAFLVAEHPYDVPECIALAPVHVAGPYLGWLRAATAR